LYLELKVLHLHLSNTSRVGKYRDGFVEIF